MPTNDDAFRTAWEAYKKCDCSIAQLVLVQSKLATAVEVLEVIDGGLATSALRAQFEAMETFRCALRCALNRGS
jgi:hypothetical protein